MRRNQLILDLKNSKTSFGLWITIPDYQSVRELARSHFSWLAIDLEHTPIDFETLSYLLGAIADAGCTPLVRIPEISQAWMKRALDSGAFGIIAPMVETRKQAELVVSTCRYPPVGTRSAGGGLHCQNFDCTLDEYFLNANEQIAIILQTESPLGIDNADDIYSTDEVTAIFVGPLDLKFRMRGDNGDFPSQPQIDGEIDRALNAAVKHNKPIGINAANAVAGKELARSGFSMISLGSDMEAMLRGVGSIGIEPHSK